MLGVKNISIYRSGKVEISLMDGGSLFYSNHQHQFPDQLFDHDPIKGSVPNINMDDELEVINQIFERFSDKIDFTNQYRFKFIQMRAKYAVLNRQMSFNN